MVARRFHRKPGQKPLDRWRVGLLHRLAIQIGLGNSGKTFREIRPGLVAQMAFKRRQELIRHGATCFMFAPVGVHFVLGPA